MVAHVKWSAAEASAWIFIHAHVSPPPPSQWTVSVCGGGGPWTVIPEQASYPEHVSVQSAPSARQVRSSS